MSKTATHEALGNLRKQLRDRTGKHKLFTITVEHHEPGEPGGEKPPEPDLPEEKEEEAARMR